MANGIGDAPSPEIQAIIARNWAQKKTRKVFDRPKK